MAWSARPSLIRTRGQCLAPSQTLYEGCLRHRSAQTASTRRWRVAYGSHSTHYGAAPDHCNREQWGDRANRQAPDKGPRDGIRVLREITFPSSRTHRVGLGQTTQPARSAWLADGASTSPGWSCRTIQEVTRTGHSHTKLDEGNPLCDFAHPPCQSSCRALD